VRRRARGPHIAAQAFGAQLKTARTCDRAPRKDARRLTRRNQPVSGRFGAFSRKAAAAALDSARRA